MEEELSILNKREEEEEEEIDLTDHFLEEEESEEEEEEERESFLSLLKRDQKIRAPFKLPHLSKENFTENVFDKAKYDTEDIVHNHLSHWLQYIQRKNQIPLPVGNPEDCETAASRYQAFMNQAFIQKEAEPNTSSQRTAEILREKCFKLLEKFDEEELKLRKELLQILSEQEKNRLVSPTEIEARVVTLNVRFDMACENLIRCAQSKIRSESQTKGVFAQEVQAGLLGWFQSHLDDPYPRHEEKEELSKRLGITVKQVSYWFANRRVRYWKHKGKEEEQPKKRKIDLEENRDHI